MNPPSKHVKTSHLFMVDKSRSGIRLAPVQSPAAWNLSGCFTSAKSTKRRITRNRTANAHHFPKPSVCPVCFVCFLHVGPIDHPCFLCWSHIFRRFPCSCQLLHLWAMEPFCAVVWWSRSRSANVPPWRVSHGQGSGAGSFTKARDAPGGQP